MERRRALSPAARWILVFGVTLVTVFALAVGATAAAIYRAGSVRVAVRSEHGADFSLRVPAGLLELAIAITPSAPLRELGRELEPWSEDLHRVWPVLDRSYEELVAAPDFVLLDVRGATDDDDRIHVRKEGLRLVVEVHSQGDDVRVVLPLRTVSRALDKLERGLIDG